MSSVWWLTQSRDQLLTCHCSKLTSNDELDWWDQSLSSDSCLLHACSKACFVCAYYMHVVKLVTFVFIAFDRACSVHVYYMHVVELVFWWRAQSRDHFMSFHVIVADSLFLSFKQTLSIQLQIFNDERISAHIFVFSDI